MRASFKRDDKPLRKQALGLIVGDGFSSQDEHIRIVMPARDFHHEIIVANASSNPGNLITDDGFSLAAAPNYHGGVSVPASDEGTCPEA